MKLGPACVKASGLMECPLGPQVACQTMLRASELLTNLRDAAGRSSSSSHAKAC